MKSPKGFYTVFNLAIQRDEHAGPNWPSRIRFDFKDIGVYVHSVHLADTQRLNASYIPHDNSGRYAFWLSDGNKDDEKAQRVIDSFLATVTLLYQIDLTRMLPFDTGPVACWLPERILRFSHFLKHNDLIKHDPSLKIRIEYSATIHQPVVKTAWKLLPIVFQDPYFDAVHFYQACVKDFCFMGDSVSAVLYGDLTQPVSRSEFARAEDAILNAFKAVEAIVGDPPKDDDRFHTKLRTMGIDPNVMVGYVGRGFDKGIGVQEPIAQKIRRMSDARDKKAAHGRTKSDRRITFYELMDYQALAEVVITTAIEHDLKRHNGS